MITFVMSLDGDYEGMYIGDRLILEGDRLHSLDVAWAISRSTLSPTCQFQIGSISQECLEQYDAMPNRLTDVVFDKDFPLRTWEP